MLESKKCAELRDIDHVLDDLFGPIFVVEVHKLPESMAEDRIRIAKTTRYGKPPAAIHLWPEEATVRLAC